MAGRGPAPNPDAIRRNKRPEAPLDTDDVAPAPDLNGDWPESVVERWNTWATSPQARSFFATDWLRLKMLVPLWAAYDAEPSTKLLAEIRLNEERLGATVADRLRLNLKPAEKVERPKTPASKRRGLKAV